MPDEDLEQVKPPAEAPPPPEEPVGDDWKLNKAGKQYVNAPHRTGYILRRGEESIAEAIARDQRPKDQMPKAKKGKAKPPTMPDRPDDVDLRTVEEILAEAFRSPAMVAAMLNDEYLANHFTQHGPHLARNLVKNAEVNPWLRIQLEKMAAGGTAAVTLFSLMGLAGALLMYIGPPVVYIFDLPVGDSTRMMMQIPPSRRERQNADNGHAEAAHTAAA